MHGYGVISRAPDKRTHDTAQRRMHTDANAYAARGSHTCIHNELYIHHRDILVFEVHTHTDKTNARPEYIEYIVVQHLNMNQGTEHKRKKKQQQQPNKINK